MKNFLTIKEFENSYLINEANSYNNKFDYSTKQNSSKLTQRSASELLTITYSACNTFL